MTIYLSDRTGASIDSVLDDADSGGIGKLGRLITSLDDEKISGFTYADGVSATGSPSASAHGYRGTRFIIRVILEL